MEELKQYDLVELIQYIFLGILMLIAMWRIAIYILDDIIGGIFWAVVKFIKNYPNKLKKKRGRENE